MLHKRVLAAFLSALLLLIFSACSDTDGSASPTQYENSQMQSEIDDSTDSISQSLDYNSDQNVQSDIVMNIQVNDYLLKATLVENSTTQALVELLSEGPITIDMRDYGSMEKVGTLPESLPTNDESIETEPGDLILYQGNSFVIYYDTNSWELTRIGKINDITQQELKEILGSGDVTVSLSLPDTE